MSHRLRILGIPFDAIDRREARMVLQEGLSASEPHFMHVVTLNPEYVMAARRQPLFRSAIEQAELILCDGVGVLIAARLVKPKHRTERCTGVDLANTLIALSAFEESGGMFLLGGRDAMAAMRTIAKRQPAARLCGAWSEGTPSPAHDQETIDRIASSGASMLLVGYGAPDQVLWIERNRLGLQSIGIRIAIGVGGVLDYLSGHASPAPASIRSAGLEWLYRLWREPWRWRRQTQLVPFGLMVLFDALRQMPCRILSRSSPQTRRQDREH